MLAKLDPQYFISDQLLQSARKRFGIATGNGNPALTNCVAFVLRNFGPEQIDMPLDQDAVGKAGSEEFILLLKKSDQGWRVCGVDR